MWSMILLMSRLTGGHSMSASWRLEKLGYQQSTVCWQAVGADRTQRSSTATTGYVGDTCERNEVPGASPWTRRPIAGCYSDFSVIRKFQQLTNNKVLKVILERTPVFSVFVSYYYGTQICSLLTPKLNSIGQGSFGAAVPRAYVVPHTCYQRKTKGSFVAFEDEMDIIRQGPGGI